MNAPGRPDIPGTDRNTAEERLHATLESMSDGFFTLDREWRLTYLNPVAERLMNRRREHLIGKVLWDEFPGAKELSFFAEYQRAIRENRTVVFEEFYPPLDTWYEVRAHPSADGLSVYFRDITEIFNARNKLRESEEKFRLLARATNDAIWDWNLKTNELVWNEGLHKLFGFPVEEVQPTIDAWKEQIHPDDRDDVVKELEAAIARGDSEWRAEYRFVRRDGTVAIVSDRGFVMRDASGEPTRMVGGMKDLTKERRREARLARALEMEKELTRKARAGERAKSQFLAVMSHEIRTPMNGVLGFAELLARAPELGAESREYAETITASGRALLHVLDDILDLSRVDSGRLKLQAAPFSPHKFIDNIRLLLALGAKEKGIFLKVEVDDRVPDQLLGDAQRLRQVLLNLAGNAVKFTMRGGVTIAVRRADAPAADAGATLYEFSVSDTGQGISGADMEHIFEPFMQADSSSARLHGGVGLGLTICKRLAELMGGTLAASSRLGAGSEFVFTVPLRQPDGSTPAIEETQESDLNESFAAKHPLNILVVEDDAVNLKLIQTMTRKLGYDPLSARTGLEALDIHRRNHADCILMDLQMPRMDGITAARKIREMKSCRKPGEKPFIAALTANTIPADRARCFAAGMNDYLNKPVNRAALARILVKAASGGSGAERDE